MENMNEIVQRELGALGFRILQQQAEIARLTKVATDQAQEIERLKAFIPKDETADDARPVALVSRRTKTNGAAAS